MKKITAIFLFLVFVLCSSGFYISWYISLQHIRSSQKEIILKSGFHKDKIVRFTIAKKDIETKSDFNFESANEFEFKNQMYDVVGRQIIGDSLYINCISDTEEDNLKDIVISQILKTGKNNTGRELPILKFRLDHYTNDITNIRPAFIAVKGIRCYQTYLYGIPAAPFLNIAQPPPWSHT